ACLRRHGLPLRPAELGLTDEAFVRAVAHAPNTRPDRYTILEHLALTPREIAAKLEAYLEALAGIAAPIAPMPAPARTRYGANARQRSSTNVYPSATSATFAYRARSRRIFILSSAPVERNWSAFAIVFR